jgi:hypothetical protein
VISKEFKDLSECTFKPKIDEKNKELSIKARLRYEKGEHRKSKVKS